MLYLLYQLSRSNPGGANDSVSESVQRAFGSAKQRPEVDQRTEFDQKSLSQRLNKSSIREVEQNVRLDDRRVYNRYKNKKELEDVSVDKKNTPLEVTAQEDNETSGDKEAQIRPSESDLLRELPFTLQGLSSTNLIFTSATTLSLPANLPLPLVSLLHTLAEPSLLYRSLSEFVRSGDEGLVSQSLRAAIGTELRSYLGLIATLEGEIRGAIISIKDTHPQTTLGKAGVTLKRCVVWTREATLGLRLMSLMAEESRSKYDATVLPISV